MKCRIETTPQGDIIDVKTQDGDKSLLFSDAVKEVGSKEEAVKIVAVTETEDFKNAVTNSRKQEIKSELLSRLNTIPTTTENVVKEDMTYTSDKGVAELVPHKDGYKIESVLGEDVAIYKKIVEEYTQKNQKIYLPTNTSINVINTFVNAGLIKTEDLSRHLLKETRTEGISPKQLNSNVTRYLSDYLTNNFGININIRNKEEISNEVSKRTGEKLEPIKKRDIVYGFYDSATDEIFLTEEYLNSGTLLHELWHMWKPILKRKGDAQSKMILDKMSQLVDEVGFDKESLIERFKGQTTNTSVDFSVSFNQLPLTLKVLESKPFLEMRDKQVNPVSVQQMLNGSTIKQIERDIINQVIEENYKGQKRISYNELETLIRANIMPLERIISSSYADYGMDNLGSGNYGEAKTLILNAPVEHGVTGHFSGDFKASGRKNIKYTPKQLNDNVWVAVEEGYESQANNNNIYQYVGTAGTKEAVDAWIENYENPKKDKYQIDDVIFEITRNDYDNNESMEDLWSSRVEIRDVDGKYLFGHDNIYGKTDEQLKKEALGILNSEERRKVLEINKGMFGHIRVWQDGQDYYVAELQSDYFQKNNARKNILENSKEYEDAETVKSKEEDKLKDKRNKTLLKLKDLGYRFVTSRKGASTQTEVYIPKNEYGLPLGDKTGVKVAGEDGSYTIYSNGKNINGSYYANRQVAETELERLANKEAIDLDKIEYLSKSELPLNLQVDFDFLTKNYYQEQKNIEKNFNKKVEKIIQNLPKDQKQFIASQKIWEQRMVREAIKEASLSGATSLRFPTPYTLSVIEGYIKGGGLSSTTSGDIIEYLGEDYIILNGSEDDGVRIVPVRNMTKVSIEDFEQLKNEGEIDENEDIYDYYLGDIGEGVESSDGQYFYYNRTYRPQGLETIEQGSIDGATKENFEISNLNNTQQTVARKYEEIAKILDKEKPTEIVTDENGFDWYEVKIGEEDKTRPVVAFSSVLSSSVYNPRKGESQEDYIDRMREEIEANLLGDNAEAYFSKMMGDAGYSENEKQSFLTKLKNFVKMFSSWLANQLGFENITPEQAVKMTSKEALDRITTTLLRDGIKKNDNTRTRGFQEESQQRRDRTRWDDSRGAQTLEGAPIIEGATGAIPELVTLAEEYALANNIPYRRQSKYVEVDEDRAKRIANEYEKMEHAPQDPKVKEAYQNLINQTIAQYKVLVDAGYKFYFYDETNDPYAGNPYNAMRDLRANKVMGSFITDAGFGSNATELDVSNNPMLSETGLYLGFGSVDGTPRKVLANDLFRIVHDTFGHGLEGAGFRARGEENAWQAHARLFTGSAVAAITSETRGQNSWLNFGEFGEKNKNAKVEDTVFADQKTGLMPEWTWKEGFDEGNTIQFQIIGEQGASNLDLAEESTIRLDNLLAAKEMEKAGKTPLEIRLATGWEKNNVDGKWRYEILDGKFKTVELNFNKKDINFEKPSAVLKMSDIYVNEELYRAYPNLKNSVVTVFDTEKELFNSSVMFTYLDRLYINKKYYKDDQNRFNFSGLNPETRGVLLHEIQHLLQFNEGFGKGGSQQYIANRIKATLNEPSFGDVNVVREASSFENQLEKTLRKELPEKSYNEFVNEKNELYIDVIANSLSYKLYRRLSGEAEADNVINRMDFDAKKRLITLLEDTSDIKQEDLILLENYLGTNEFNKSGIYDLIKKGKDLDLAGEEVVINPTVENQKGFDKNGEPTLKTVLTYVNNFNNRGRKLTYQIKEAVSNFTEDELKKLKQTFFSKGIFTVEKAKLENSGLYNKYEIAQITKSVPLQESIKNAILASENYQLKEGFREFFETTSELDVLGKMKRTYIDQDLIKTLAGVKTIEEMDKKAASLPYPSFQEKYPTIRENLFSRMKNYRVVKSFDEEMWNSYLIPNGSLSEELEGAITNLLTNKDYITPQEAEDYLKAIESMAVREGVDLVGLHTFIEEDSLEAFLEALVSEDSSVGSLYKNLFQKGDLNPPIIVKTNAPAESLVSISEKNEVKAFEERGLVRVADKVYLKVPKLDNFYEQIKKGLPTKEDAKTFLQSNVNKLELLGNGEILERILGFKYWFNLPLTSTYDRIMSQDMADIANTETEFRFPINFYSSMLQSNLRGDELSKDFYSNIHYDGKTLKLVDTSIEAVQKMKDIIEEGLVPFAKEFVDYTALDVEGVSLNTKTAYDTSVDNLRSFYISYPKALPLYKDNYSVDGNKGIVVINASKPFLRTLRGVYELAETKYNVSYYNFIGEPTSEMKVGKSLKNNNKGIESYEVEAFEVKTFSTKSKQEKMKIKEDKFDCR